MTVAAKALAGQVLKWAEAVDLQSQRILDPTVTTMNAIVDPNLMLLALRNLVRAAEAAANHTTDQRITDAVDTFKASLPGVVDMRDVVEHFDAYLEGRGKLQKRLRSPTGLPYFETFQRQPGVFQLMVTPKFTLNVGDAAEAAIKMATDVLVALTSTGVRTRPTARTRSRDQGSCTQPFTRRDVDGTPSLLMRRGCNSPGCDDYLLIEP